MPEYTKSAMQERDRDREEAATDCRFQHPNALPLLIATDIKRGIEPPKWKVFKPGELTRKDILPSEADNDR